MGLRTGSGPTGELRNHPQRKRVLATAQVLGEDLVYEMRLVVGAFRARRTTHSGQRRIELFSRDSSVIADLWFRD
jgi:hypothetical protein